MRFEVKKSANGDNFVIWDTKLKQNYKTNGILMRGTEADMQHTADQLNRLQSTKDKLQKKSGLER